MLKIALKSLLAHKLRMFFTAFSVVMGVAFIAGTFMFTDSISNSFNSLFDDIYRGIDLTISPTEPEFGDTTKPLTDQDLATVLESDGVRTAVGEVDGFAQILDKAGEPIGTTGLPALGFSWITEPELNVLSIKDGNGRGPMAAGEVAIDANTAAANDFALGDTVSIQALGPVEEFELVGIVSFGEADTLLGATISVFELDEAQRLFGFGANEFGTISAKVDTDTTPEAVQPTIQERLGEGATVTTSQQETDANQQEVDGVLGALNSGIASFGIISLFVACFIIYNTFQIIVSQRSKELALLRAIGATRRQVIRTILYEALAIGALASALGIIAGVGLAEAIRAVLESANLGLPQGDLAIEARTIIAGFVVGIGATVIAALVPAIKASKVSPVQALSDTQTASRGKSFKLRTLTSGIASLAGLATLWYGLFASGVDNRLVPVGGGVFLLFMGISGLAPFMVRPITALLARPTIALRGVPGQIAVGNTKRTPRRSASTASALMIGVSLVTVSSVFAASVNRTIDVVVEDSFPADVIALSNDFSAFDAVPQQLSDELRALEDIEVVAQIRYTEVKIGESDIRLATFAEPDSFGQVLKLDPSDEDFSELDPGELYARSTFVDEQGWDIGQNVSIDIGDGAQDLVLAGTYDKDFDTKIILHRRDLIQTIGPTGDTYLSANFRGGVDFEQARAAVNDVAKRYPSVTIQDLDELIEQQKSFINGALTAVWALLGFSIIIAIIGITNTLSLSVIERKREIGLLRAVGMTGAQTRSMIRIEAILLSLFGALMGILMGIFFGWALVRALESEGFSEFAIPYTQLVLYFVFAAIAGIVASIWPAISASRISVLEAINYE